MQKCPIGPPLAKLLRLANESFAVCSISADAYRLLVADPLENEIQIASLTSALLVDVKIPIARWLLVDVQNRIRFLKTFPDLRTMARMPPGSWKEN